METTAETGLAKMEGTSLAVTKEGERVLAMRQHLADESAMRQMVGEFVHHHMVENTDFGKIPGTDKPTLLKPGAEKLLDLFRAKPSFSLVKIEEDFEKGYGFFNYIFRVRLKARGTGEVLAEGFGSANSREGRYRWRNANLKCPDCGAETLLKSKRDPEFYCWKKKGGCGATFPLDEPRITGQVAGKVENEDIATLANTILKMAKKRALVDGAIALARCSDLFTQDVEDLEHGHEEPARPQQSAPQQGQVRAPSQASAKATKPAPTKPTEEQQLEAAFREKAKRILNTAMAELGIKQNHLALWVGEILGTAKPSAQWNSDDMAKVESALTSQLKAKASQQQPQP